MRSSRKLRPIKLLTREEERDLLQRWCIGRDERARDALVLAHVPLAEKIAKRYRAGADLDDLRQECIAALLVAADRFDASSPNGFATYAQWWVEDAARQFVARQGSAMRRPITRGKTAPVPVVLSLNKPVGVMDGSTTTLADLIPDTGPLPDEIVLKGAVERQVMRRLASATRDNPRARQVILARFFAEDTLEAIANRLGITKERVRQIEAATLGKMAAEYGRRPARAAQRAA